MSTVPDQSLTIQTGNAGLAVTGGAATFSTANATVFSVNGITYARAAQTATAVPSTDVNTGAAWATRPIPAGFGAVLLMFLDTASTPAFRLAMGDIVPLSSATVFSVAPQLPSIPDGHCPIGYITVKNNSLANFVVGTTNWNASGVTSVAGTLTTLPARPIS